MPDEPAPTPSQKPTEAGPTRKFFRFVGQLLRSPGDSSRRAVAEPGKELREFLQACHTMKLYAMAKGVAIPERTRKLIVKLAPIEAEVAALPADAPIPNLTACSIGEALDVAMETHAALSELVAPATPASIVATRPPNSVSELWKNQRAVSLLLVASFFAILGFVGCLIWKQTLGDRADHIRKVLAVTTLFEKHLAEADKLQVAATGLTAEQAIVIEDMESRSRELAVVTKDLGLLSWSEAEMTKVIGDIGKPAPAG
ncbi:MAG: hypothetical protein ACOYN0_14455, partial [Phycisphaerales bacterium]